MQPPKLLIKSPQISPSIAVLPFFLSYKSPLLQRPKLSLETHLLISTKQYDKTPFLGKTLVLGEKYDSLWNTRKTHVPVIPIRAIVKRRKELPFDNVIQRDKKLNLVFKIRKILVSQPDRIMALREMGRFRKLLGLQKKRRFIALLRKFPAVFEIVEEGVYSLQFRLTPEAERLYLEEIKIKNETEDLLVIKLRKMLMMSVEKRILLEKIAHVRTDLGLPFEFRDTICRRYPQYFKVVATGRGPALELTHWDPELAISAAELVEEENREIEVDDKDGIIDRPRKFHRVLLLPKGLKLSKGEMRMIHQFRYIPFISPYSDFSTLRSGTLEKEKHASAVVHEMLSLTVEKRTLVDHFTHFREEFGFSQQLRGMLIRHPDMFYVSLKGDRDSVFLREAFHDSQLVEKDRLLLIKEKLRALVAVPRFRASVPKTDSDFAEGTSLPGDGDGDEEEEEWSDIDNLASDEFDEDYDEDGEDYDDKWSDEEYDMPPDFKKDDGNVTLRPSKPNRQADSSTKNEERVCVPVFPDGRQRERW